MLRKIREFLHTYPYALLLIYPVVHVLFFFLLNQLPLEHHLISCSLDAKIPFCEWFIIPYFIWFIYLFGGMIFFLFVSREDFLRMAIYTMETSRKGMSAPAVAGSPAMRCTMAATMARSTGRLGAKRVSDTPTMRPR